MRFPGTPLYRSPESWLFEVRFYGDATARYRPSHADDLYALGVTACRLLTGEYPELAAPSRDERGTLRQEGVLLPRALVRNPGVDPVLRALTLRLLSIHPEQRGTAAQLAQALEPTLEPFRPGSRRWRRWSLAATGLALIIGASWAVMAKPWQERSVAQAGPLGPEAAQEGTAGLGDAAMSLSLEETPTISPAEGMGEAPCQSQCQLRCGLTRKDAARSRGRSPSTAGAGGKPRGSLKNARSLGARPSRAPATCPSSLLGAVIPRPRAR